MKYLSTTIVLIVTLLFTSHVNAQNNIPVEQLVFDKFVGDYDIKRTLWDNEGNSSVTYGRAVMTSPFGGRYFTVTEYDEDGELHFIGWHRFNPDTGKYENGAIGYFDDGTITSGNFDKQGKALTQQGSFKNLETGEQIDFRGVMSWINPDKHIYEWFTKGADGFFNQRGGLYEYEKNSNQDLSKE